MFNTYSQQYLKSGPLIFCPNLFLKFYWFLKSKSLKNTSKLKTNVSMPVLQIKFCPIHRWIPFEVALGLASFVHKRQLSLHVKLDTWPTGTILHRLRPNGNLVVETPFTLLKTIVSHPTTYFLLAHQHLLEPLEAGAMSSLRASSAAADCLP